MGLFSLAAANHRFIRNSPYIAQPELRLFGARTWALGQNEHWKCSSSPSWRLLIRPNGEAPRVRFSNSLLNRMFNYVQTWLAQRGLTATVLSPPSYSNRIVSLFSNIACSIEGWQSHRQRYTRFRSDQYAERGLLTRNSGYWSEQQPHDEGSWCILVLNEYDEVLGTVSCRLFDGRIVHDWIYAYRIVAGANQDVAARYTKYIDTFFSSKLASLGACAEVSNWAVAARHRRSPVSIFLVFAAAALCHALAAC